MPAPTTTAVSPTARAARRTACTAIDERLDHRGVLEGTASGSR